MLILDTVCETDIPQNKELDIHKIMLSSKDFCVKCQCEYANPNGGTDYVYFTRAGTPTTELDYFIASCP